MVSGSLFIGKCKALGHEKGEAGSLEWSVISLTQIKGELHEWRQPGSLSNCFASSCVMRLAIYRFKMDVFETDASTIKSLMPATHFTIKKHNTQHLELPLWHNGIHGILRVLGCGFDPQPGTAG